MLPSISGMISPRSRHACASPPSDSRPHKRVRRVEMAESERNMSERNMPPARKRIDTLLVERGLFESRARARAAIEAGLRHAPQRAGVKTSERGGAHAVVQGGAAAPFV